MNDNGNETLVKGEPSPPPHQKLAAHQDTLEKSRAVLFERWKAELERENGYISRAARTFVSESGEVGITKKYAMLITRMFKLNEYACELRIAAGGRAHGRPPDGA